MEILTPPPSNWHRQYVLFSTIPSKRRAREFKVAVGPAPQRVSRAIRARNPRRVRKESGKSTPEQGPKSAERVRRRVSEESEKSPKESESQVLDSFRTLLRLRGALFHHFWGPAPGALSGLFSGFRARSARETLCRAGPTANLRCASERGGTCQGDPSCPPPPRQAASRFEKLPKDT